MSLSDGMWMAAWMKSQRVSNEHERRAGTLEESMLNLADILGETNDMLVSARSERDSYKSLSTEMVKEIKGLKPVRLSAPNADSERRAHLENEFRLSAKSYIKEVEDQYQNFPPKVADRARNNAGRKEALQRKVKPR